MTVSHSPDPVAEAPRSEAEATPPGPTSGRRVVFKMVFDDYVACSPKAILDWDAMLGRYEPEMTLQVVLPRKHRKPRTRRERRGWRRGCR
jgi:hypothetical protein